MGTYKWVISRITMVITPMRGLITPYITTHEPPSICTLILFWGPVT